LGVAGSRWKGMEKWWDKVGFLGLNYFVQRGERIDRPHYIGRKYIYSSYFSIHTNMIHTYSCYIVSVCLKYLHLKPNYQYILCDPLKEEKIDGCWRPWSYADDFSRGCRHRYRGREWRSVVVGVDGPSRRRWLSMPFGIQQAIVVAGHPDGLHDGGRSMTSA
jgi:hypothetical protein